MADERSDMSACVFLPDTCQAARLLRGAGAAGPQHLASESMQLQERTTVASHSLTPQQAAELHKVDAQSGLSSSEAAQRLALHGPNCARHAHLCPSLRALPGL